MSTDHTQSKGGPTPDVDPGSSALSRVAAELEALGEPALDDVEQVAVMQAAVAPTGPSTEQTTVQTLMGLAEPLPVALARPLSELGLARVYRTVAIRLSAAAQPSTRSTPAVSTPRRSLMTTLAVVAAAAAFALVPVLNGNEALLDTPRTREQSRSLRVAQGAALRAGVQALGSSGSQRARSLAQDYAARMQAAPVGGRR